MNEKLARKIGAQISIAAVFGIGFLLLSRMPFHMSSSHESALIVTFRSAASASEVCRPATADELAKMLPHMRREKICERSRPQTRMRINIDGTERLNKLYKPLGLNSDGVTVAFENIGLNAGLHEVEILMKDTLDGPEWDHSFQQKIEFVKNRRYLVEFKKDKGFLLHGTE